MTKKWFPLPLEIMDTLYNLHQQAEELKNDKEVVSIAVRRCGWALKHASAGRNLRFNARTFGSQINSEITKK